MKRAITSRFALPALIEDVADHRGAAFGAKLRQEILERSDAAEAFRLQRGTEIPIVHIGAHFAAECLCRQ